MDLSQNRKQSNRSNSPPQLTKRSSRAGEHYAQQPDKCVYFWKKSKRLAWVVVNLLFGFGPGLSCLGWVTGVFLKERGGTAEYIMWIAILAVIIISVAVGILKSWEGGCLEIGRDRLRVSREPLLLLGLLPTREIVYSDVERYGVGEGNFQVG